MDSTPPRPQSRRQSVFSFKSYKSHESDPSVKPQKVDVKNLKEPSKKRYTSRIGQSSRDPNTAISEIEPGVRAQNESSTIPYLRSVQHRDYKGDIITDPDASNPARHRLERPLDTIRSFEAAIDSGYKRRSAVNRSESADMSTFSQTRNGFVNGNETPPNRRFSSTTGGYGGPRMQYPRHVETHHYTRPNHSRHPTAPISNDPASEYSMYPNNTYRESPDTVYTRESNGSQSTEPWTNSTDPSSENSSVDRTQYAQKVDHDAYGAAYSHRSPRHGAIHEYHEHEQYAPSEDPPFSHPSHIPTQQQYSYNQNGKGSMGPPPVPMHAAGAPAQIRQGNSMLNGPTAPSEATGMPKLQKIPSEGKRKSWLKRRFSKG